MTKEEFIEKIKNGYGLSEELQIEIVKEQLEDSMNKKNLSIDIETYSSKDIGKCGLYNYVQSADFEILLFAYAFDDEEVKIIDLARGEQLPDEIVIALSDNNIVKTAYNAAFEWYCLSKFWHTPIEQWRCTMVKRVILWISCGTSFNRQCDGSSRG